MPNPITKRGLFRQHEPAPIVTELSRLGFTLMGGQWREIARNARSSGFSLADETVGRILYCETRQPRAETVEAFLAGCGITTRMFLPDGTEYFRMDRSQAIREWHHENTRRQAKPKKAVSK